MIYKKQQLLGLKREAEKTDKQTIKQGKNKELKQRKQTKTKSFILGWLATQFIERKKKSREKIGQVTDNLPEQRNVMLFMKELV